MPTWCWDTALPGRTMPLGRLDWALASALVEAAELEPFLEPALQEQVAPWAVADTSVGCRRGSAEQRRR